MSDTSQIPDVTAVSLYQAAVDLVEQVRRANERRLAEARSLAGIVKLADEVMAQRILTVVETANTRDLATAEQQSQEIITAARSGIASAVRKYADLLVEQQRMVNESRMPKARQLIDLIRVADEAAADRLLARIEEANQAALKDAEEQAQRVMEMARARLLGRGDEAAATPAAESDPPALQITPLVSDPEAYSPGSTEYNIPKPNLDASVATATEAVNPNGQQEGSAQ